MPSFELTFDVRKKDASGKLLSTHVVTAQKTVINASDSAAARKLLVAQYGGAAVVTNTRTVR